jgi:hypothetical protein
MNASNFAKLIEEIARSKNLGWTSFEERRMWKIGKKLEKREIDADQAIEEVKGELKSYNVSRDDVKKIKEKLR